MIKNFFYAKVRKELRRLNNEFKKIEAYKSITFIIKRYLGLNVTQQMYFRLLKEFNASVLELATFPLSTIAEVIINARKKPSKIKKAIRKPTRTSSKRLPEIGVFNSNSTNLYSRKLIINKIGLMNKILKL